MPSDSGDRRVVRGVAQLSVTEKKEQDQLECPRCESKNTKFCYYNNYNLSQPRHFCKSCRRYWTHGGTLRDVPVGGSTRSSSSSKPTKRSRSSSSTTKTTTSPPVLSPPLPPPASGTEFLATHIPTSGTESLGSFTSLLASSSTGFLGLLEPVPNRACPVLGFDGLGFELGLGRGGSMSLPEVGDMTSGNTWHLGIGDGLGDVDCSFPWPDLAISTPASASGLQ